MIKRRSAGSLSLRVAAHGVCRGAIQMKRGAGRSPQARLASTIGQSVNSPRQGSQLAEVLALLGRWDRGDYLCHEFAATYGVGRADRSAQTGLRRPARSGVAVKVLHNRDLLRLFRNPGVLLAKAMLGRLVPD